MALAILIVQAIIAGLPEILKIVGDLSNSKITAEEAEVQASLAFTTMWARLAKIADEERAINDQIDAEARTKFPPA